MCEAAPAACTLPVWRDSTLCVNHIGLKIGRHVARAASTKKVEGSEK